MSDHKDYYKTLGVDKKADPEKIRRAYRKLALKWHPDRNVGKESDKAEKKFKEINQAYEVLSDPEKRRKYDAGGFDMSGAHFTNAEDIFKRFFERDGGGGFGNMGAGGFPGIFQSFDIGGGGGADMFKMGAAFPGMGMSGGFPGQGMNPFGGAARPQQRKPQGPLATGTKVSIYGLSKKKEHNNKAGKITDFNHDSKRFIVTLDDDSMISLKGKNIMQQISVLITGNNIYHGQKAKVEGYLSDRELVICKIQGRKSATAGLPRTQLLLGNGTTVRLEGLKGAANLNGQWGKVTQWNADRERYMIKLLGNSRIILVKPENVWF